MKAFILAAGLGTRLKPWTLSHPKALVPVGGVPMLGRVIDNLKKQGFDDISLNIHHFGSQILDFIGEDPALNNIKVSDESECLLDTGGALLHALPLLGMTPDPVLVHNVDILSDADLKNLFKFHVDSDADATLLVSNRSSSRRLIFTPDMRLCGWHNLQTDEYKPAHFTPEAGAVELAFSGIYVISPSLIEKMSSFGFSGKFSIIDFFIAACSNCKILGVRADELNLIDIGKPETLSQAQLLYKNFL